MYEKRGEMGSRFRAKRGAKAHAGVRGGVSRMGGAGRVDSE